MSAQSVIAIYDVGKTNKKLLLFNEKYEVVHEQAGHCPETTDEDGFPCEDLKLLQGWMRESLHRVFQKCDVAIQAINSAAYGASLVHVDKTGQPALPLYNYLKPYPQELQQKLYAKYGGAKHFAVATASPVLGSLNSGLQLYRIKEQQPALFQQLKTALHLPQYLSYLITGNEYSDITSIGCHTALWDFEKVGYHHWVTGEGLLPKLAPLHASDEALSTIQYGNNCKVGIGLHDSSAALIPYRVCFKEPFLLISTGTWCISLNPFNQVPLTAAELAQDCLCYMDYKGRPVKAARVFLGPQYDAGVERICSHFLQHRDRYRAVLFDSTVLATLKNKTWGFEKVPFARQEMDRFESDIQAYHALMLSLMQQQQVSANLVLQDNAVKQIFVDGGFAKNDVYMNLLAAHFPDQKVYAASMAQGTALGAALAIHKAWNKSSIPESLVHLKFYPRTTALP